MTGAIAEAIAAYRKADRLDRLGFSGGSAASLTVPPSLTVHGARRRLRRAGDRAVRRVGPGSRRRTLAGRRFIRQSTRHRVRRWALRAASRVRAPDDTVPDIAEAPSQSDSFDGRPRCQEQFLKLWPKMVAEQPIDVAYRRLYYYLHKLVDQAIGRILQALDDSGMADDTIVVFTSDHGDLLGAHGGMQQKSGQRVRRGSPLFRCSSKDQESFPRPVGDHPHQPRRPHSHSLGPRRHRRRNGRPHSWPSITPRPTRSPVET